MSFTYSVDKSVGSAYFDTRAKTQLGFPVVYAKDIENCGNKDYASSQISADIKYRDGCAAPVTAINVSISGLTRFSVGSNQPQLDELLEYMAPVVFDLSPTPDIAKITPLAGSFDFRGNEYVNDKVREGLGAIRVSIPRVTDLFDACDNIIGRVASASISILAFDPITCKPYLKSSSSVKVAVNDSVPWGTLSAGDAETVLKSQVKSVGIITTAPSGGFANTNANLTANYIANFKAAYALNTNYTLGVA